MFSCGRTIENVAHAENPSSKDWHVDGCVFANSGEDEHIDQLRTSREVLETLRRSLSFHYGTVWTNVCKTCFMYRVDIRLYEYPFSEKFH